MPRVGVNSGAWVGFNHDYPVGDTPYLTSPHETVPGRCFEVEDSGRRRMVGTMKPRLFAPLFLLLCLAFAPVASADHHQEASTRVFELRIYYPHPGKIDALLARFRDHTCGIFERLGMENVGYWVETDVKEGEEPKLYYVLAHPSREQAKAAWKQFMNDPE